MGFFDIFKPLATVATGGLAAAPLAAGEGIAKGKGIGGILGDTIKAGSQGIASAASDVAGSLGGPQAEAATDAGIGLAQTVGTLGAGGLGSGMGKLGVNQAASSAGQAASKLPQISAIGGQSDIADAGKRIVERSMRPNIMLASARMPGQLPEGYATDALTGIQGLQVAGKTGDVPPITPSLSEAPPTGSFVNPMGSGGSTLSESLTGEQYSAMEQLPQNERAEALMNVPGLGLEKVGQSGSSPFSTLGFRDYLGMASAGGTLASSLMPKPEPKKSPRAGNIGGQYVNMFKRGI